MSKTLPFVCFVCSFLLACGNASSSLPLSPATRSAAHVRIDGLAPSVDSASLALALEAARASGEAAAPSARGRIVPADTCTSAPSVTLGPSTVSLTGSTLGRADDYGTTYACGDERPGSSPDAVVRVVLPSDGVLDLDLRATSSGWNPAVYMRTDCAQELYCWDFGPLGEHIHQPMTAGAYYVIIDGNGSSSGTFALSMTLSPPFCGDGVVTGSELCDPGAADPADGCVDPGASGECTPEPADPMADHLPGEALTISAGSPVILARTTIGYDDTASPVCSTTGQGADRFLAVTPSISGTLTIQMGLDPDGVTPTCARDITDGGCWDYALCAFTASGGMLTPISGACSDESAAGVEQISIAVTAGQPVVIDLDAYDTFSAADPVEYRLRWGWGPVGVRLDLQ